MGWLTECREHVPLLLCWDIVRTETTAMSLGEGCAVLPLCPPPSISKELSLLSTSPLPGEGGWDVRGQLFYPQSLSPLRDQLDLSLAMSFTLSQHFV